MGESRLSSLAIMHIKYDKPIDLDEVMVNLFEGLHTWMMQLQSLPYETEWSFCELIITWITVAHVVAPIYPSDLVLYVVKIIPPLKIFP